MHAVRLMNRGSAARPNDSESMRVVGINKIDAPKASRSWSLPLIPLPAGTQAAKIYPRFTIMINPTSAEDRLKIGESHLTVNRMKSPIEIGERTARRTNVFLLLAACRLIDFVLSRPWLCTTNNMPAQAIVNASKPENL